jgi:uncharacterized protein (TIGR03437 family)
MTVSYSHPKTAGRLPNAVLILVAFLFASTGLHAQSIFGQNLIVNGDAESGPSDPNGHNPITSFPGWTAQGAPDVVQYASDYDIGTTDPSPLAAGNSYFSGGRSQANASLSQTINLSSGATAIDAGTATFVLSGYLGGFQNEPESAQMTVSFLGANGGTLSSTTLGPVTESDRADISGLWYRRSLGRVPAGTRSANVVLTFAWISSNTNDGAADNLSLVLNTPVAAQSLFSSNLIVNPNAETPAVADPSLANDATVDVPGWNRIGRFTINPYGSSDADLDASTPGPPDAGSFYFYGGPNNALSSASQDIDVSSAAVPVDAATITYALSGWLGGLGGQNDNCVLGLQFQDWNGNVLGSTSLGPVSDADRNGLSELLLLKTTGNIPPGTRILHVTLTMTRTDGSDNDGLADSLSLVLTGPAGAAGSPSISAIVSDASFTAPISPGAWIAIFGTNLAPAGDSRLWNPATEIVNGKFPTSLDGTSVTVNGKPASIEFISAAQVNIQPPDDTASGPVQVVLTTSGGSSSSTVNYAQFAPGLFASSPPYIVAQHADNSYVTPTSPARPGEVVILWGSGFGPADPPVPAGQVFSGANPLADKITVTIGGQPAPVDFAGIVGAGLVQINVHIPASINNGDAAVLVMLQGVATQNAGNLIPVHN